MLQFRKITHRLSLLAALGFATLTQISCGGNGGGIAVPVAPAPIVESSVADIRFIGEQRLAAGTVFQNTTVLGLSGIDYDPRTGKWIAISDDRSDVSPARFYDLDLRYDSKSFSSATVTGVSFFKQANGLNFPSGTQVAVTGGEVPDAEAIRFDPLDSSIWWASEGVRTLGFDPFIRKAERSGSFLASLPLPPTFKVSRTLETGSRNNLAYEGLAFSPDGNELWSAMESATYEDGPVATTAAGAVARFTRQDRSGKVLAQYVYLTDPIPVAPPAGKLADNGVAEILMISDTKMLVVERSGSQDANNVFNFYIRIYEADIAGATDVSKIDSLQGARYTPMNKRLIANLNSLGLAKVDNIEGITWGPRLENGNRSLVIVSDDNFNATQVTQLLAFEVRFK
jgi:hypothetical protein